MKVLLANLPWRSQERLGVRAGSRWPFTCKPGKNGLLEYVPFPFFLSYAAALLKENGKDVYLIDAIAEGMGEERFIEKVSFLLPDILVIETSTPSFYNDIRIIGDIKKISRNQRIVLCGTHPSVFAKEVISQYQDIDFILIGEYEYVLLDLIKSLEGEIPLSSIQGIAYRQGGNVLINQPHLAMADIDNLPWPERDSLPMHSYNDGFCGLPQPNFQMWSSRGCPFSCNFCLWPQTLYKGHSVRLRNPHDVIDEMEYAINKFQFKAVFFDDDIFNADRSHVLYICQEIRKRGISLPWSVMARADMMDEVMLKEMVNSGLFAIKYGIESADEKVLKLCNKKLNLKKTVSMVDFTKKLGVKVHLSFCIGLPGETHASLEKTSDFINKVKPDGVQFSLATPFPGTEYYNYAKEKGFLLSQNWSDYDGSNKCVVRTKELEKYELEEFLVDFCNNFNL